MESITIKNYTDSVVKFYHPKDVTYTAYGFILNRDAVPYVVMEPEEDARLKLPASAAAMTSTLADGVECGILKFGISHHLKTWSLLHCEFSDGFRLHPHRWT